MTITLDNRPEIPLHPLDLTAEPPNDNQAQFCIGLIQTADPQLSNPNSSLGDMILGVPFLRNVYTVMAYTTPNADGSFTPLNGSNQTITPRLGLLSLTDPTIALEEFNTVRVLNQPISGGGSSSGGSSATGGNANNPTVNLGGKRLSVGIVVLIGLLSFFALCCVLFVVRWFIFRRKYRETATTTTTVGGGGMHQMDGDVYGVAKNSTTEVYMLSKTISSKDEKSSISDDPHVGGKVEEAPGMASSAVSNGRPKLADGGDHELGAKGGGRGRGTRDIEWENLTVLNSDNTLIQYQQRSTALDLYPVEAPDHLRSSLPPSSSSSPSFPVINTQRLVPNQTQQFLSNYDQETEVDDLDVAITNRTSMAGIGTASRTRQIDLDSSFLRDIEQR